MPEKIRVASIDEVPPGTGMEIAVGSRLIALFNVDGAFFAVDGICPHAGGPLADGTLCGSIVTCPWHGWQFDVATGRHCLNERLQQFVYPVSVEGGEVFVDVPD
jgi:nitrite reductase/ring-hydroxylating ferredoxin subunit